MKTYLKITITSIAFLSLLLMSNEAKASEVTGRLTTGISGNNGNVVEGIVIAPPIASPTAGIYTTTQSVSLTASGATSIRYTTNGTAPTCTTGTVYITPISITSSLPLEAISCYPENNHSSVASYLYAINIPAVVNTPATGGGGGGSGGGGNPSAVTFTIKADANNDGKTDIIDFVTLMANWGKTGSNNTADFNGDGKVDILDFVALMANWTK